VFIGGRVDLAIAALAFFAHDLAFGPGFFRGVPSFFSPYFAAFFKAFTAFFFAILAISSCVLHNQTHPFPV
jgi:hypothetical protein